MTVAELAESIAQKYGASADDVEDALRNLGYNDSDETHSARYLTVIKATGQPLIALQRRGDNGDTFATWLDCA